MVQGVFVSFSFLLVVQTGLSQAQRPPCDLEARYLASCNVNTAVSSTTCMQAWTAFLAAFDGKTPSVVTQADYNSYYQVLPIMVTRNQALFWSGTSALAEGISLMDPTICSSFTEPSAASVNGMGDVCWCGSSRSPGVDCVNVCNCNPRTQFWASFSTMLGQRAEGVVFWLAWGEGPGGTYQSDSFFARYEFSSLSSFRVSKLVVLDVHREGIGESCGEGSLVTLETLSVAKFGASGYTCYDVIGSASIMDREVVSEIVDIIHLEQNCECTSNQPEYIVRTLIYL